MAFVLLRAGLAGEAGGDAAVESLMRRADAAYAQGDWKEAEKGYRRALALLEARPDAPRLETIQCLAKLGKAIQEGLSRIDEAVSCAKRAEALLGDGEALDAVSVMIAANLLSEIHEAAADGPGAIAVAKLAVNKAREESAALNDVFPLLVSRLARLKLFHGDPIGVGTLFREAVETGEKVWGRDGEKLVEPLTAHGAYLAVCEAEFEAGAAAVEQALRIVEQTLGPDDPAALHPLAQLAVIRSITGDHREVDRLLRKSLSLAEKLNPAGPETARALYFLAESRFSRGDYLEADRLAARSWALYEGLGPIVSGDQIGILHMQAKITFNYGAIEEAAGLCLRAIDLANRIYGGNSYALAELHATAAAIVAEAGLRREAIREYETVDRLLALNGSSPASAARLYIAGKIAEEYLLQGRAGAAEDVLRRPWELVSESPDHPAFNHLGNAYAPTCLANGRHGEALAIAARVARNMNRSLENAFAGASERQRLDFVGNSFGGERKFMPPTLASLALLDIPERDAAASAYAANVLRTKGAVLDSILEDRERLRGSSEAAGLLERLGRDKQTLAGLLLHPPPEPEHEQAWRRRAEQLRVDIERDERELSELAGRYREGRRAARATPEAAAARLPAGSILVEFSESTVWPQGNGDGESGGFAFPAERYFAIVIRPGAVPVRVVPLGDKAEIDALVGAVQAAMRRGRAVHDSLRRLHDLVWSPLLPHLGDGRRVFISPAGELNFLPFAVLLTPEERYLGEDFTISYLASGRDLLRRPPADGDGAFAFADPDFAAGIPEPNSREDGVGETFRSGGGERRRAALAGLQLPRLPASRIEAEAMRRIFSKAAQPLTVWLGEDASKARLKAVRNPDILHLATHGFFLPADDGLASPSGKRPAPRRRDGADNPLLRSGLALAGAASALSSPNGGAGAGILTAEEVALLELWGTKLAVVSACDSGAGDLAAGEGVMGLRRAFVQAGARDLLLTLWPIEDKTTARIVEELYRGYLAGAPLDVALAEAQRREIRAARADGKNAHPRFWAPFVVSFQGAPQEWEGAAGEYGMSWIRAFIQ